MTEVSRHVVDMVDGGHGLSRRCSLRAGSTGSHIEQNFKRFSMRDFCVIPSWTVMDSAGFVATDVRRNILK